MKPVIDQGKTPEQAPIGDLPDRIIAGMISRGEHLRCPSGQRTPHGYAGQARNDADNECSWSSGQTSPAQLGQTDSNVKILHV
jgi:hypothetical protein